MHLKLLRAAATSAVLGGIVTLGLGSTQAALAKPMNTVVFVPCSTSTLINDMTNPANDTILMLASNCTYTLTAPLPETTIGLPAVMKTMTIVGNSTTWIKRSTAVETPVFNIFVVGCSTGNLTLDSVNVANGGGSTIEDGGAVDVTTTGATVTINGGTFTGNSVDPTEGMGEGLGGAIYSDGTLTVNAATFTGNSAYDGGAIYAESTEPTLKGDTFKNNSATDAGGAIYNDDTMAISGGIFTRNGAEYGGAIFNTGDITSLTGGVFSQNTASEDGGAIENDGILTVTKGLFGDNDAADGGALYAEGAAGSVTINNSQITFNYASTDGGGIYKEAGTVTLTGGLIGNNQPNNCYPLGSITGCSG